MATIETREVRTALKKLYDFCGEHITNTNPVAYMRGNVSFCGMMDDDIIAGFGLWMQANGYNTAITTVQAYVREMLHTIDVIEEVSGNG